MTGGGEGSPSAFVGTDRRMLTLLLIVLLVVLLVGGVGGPWYRGRRTTVVRERDVL